MSSRSETFAPRRILVAIDASPGSLAALEAAARLAARSRAVLLGLFVEDANLYRIARLPSARHVSLPSGAGEPLDARAVETQLRVVASRARSALEAAGRRNDVRVDFQVVRGHVAREVALASEAADLLILGCASRPLPRRPRLGRTAWAAAEATQRSVLLLPSGAVLEGPVLLVDDGSRGSELARRAAAQLAGLLRAELFVLAMPGSRGLEGALVEAPADSPAPRARTMRLESPARLRDTLHEVKGGILALSATSALVEEVCALLEETGRPMLLVR